ncbi:MAG: glycerate kinase [Friedmanniella sp.]|nr:glycerate kinase [Friedmanniella sp.]
MRILIAPDKFKGSLEAAEVAERLAAGIRRSAPAVEIELQPVADGGEGTVDAAVQSGFAAVEATVSGPTGRPVPARFALGERGWPGRTVAGDRIAVVEMAQASGLGQLTRGPRGEPRLDPLAASSRGTGELVVAALDAGATVIVLGIGGSASTDGGAGLLAALGARLLDRDGRLVPDGGGGLTRLDRVDLGQLDPRLRRTRFVLAADVTNPLLGPDGAAAVFGPQKGAGAAEVATLDAGLTRLRDALVDSLGPAAGDAAEAAGAGAAGGLGYAALAVLRAEPVPGIDLVLELVGLAARTRRADLVVTGEGSLDRQSLGGKTPLGVARMARSAGRPVVAVCGRTTLGQAETAAAGFVRTYALTDLQPDVSRCMAEAGTLLERVGEAIGAQLPALTTPTTEVL